MCKGIIVFPTFPKILTMIMYEYSKFRDRSIFERAGKQLSFGPKAGKLILFNLEKLVKYVFFAKKGWNVIFL